MAITLVDPTASARTEAFQQADRPRTLDNCSIALLANGKAHGERIVQTLASELADRYVGIRTRIWTKPHPSGPPTAAQLAEIDAFADIVISAIGDCGSCSSCSVFDGISFERRGVPTAVLISEPFTRTVHAIAAMNGAPQFRTISMRHPITSREAEDIAEEARSRVDEVISVLVNGHLAVHEAATSGVSDRDRVAALVEEFRPALLSDGSEIGISEITAAGVILHLRTIADADCAECVIPAGQIEAMFSAALAADGVTLPVTVTDDRIAA